MREAAGVTTGVGSQDGEDITYGRSRGGGWGVPHPGVGYQGVDQGRQAVPVIVDGRGIGGHAGSVSDRRPDGEGRSGPRPIRR